MSKIFDEYTYPYKWKLCDTKFTKDKGKVFSCFSCGGGSTMGYKLAGFDVIGCNEIDPRMMEIYVKNHNPKFSFCEPIQEFKTRDDLPEDLFNLDILDGSPPCSSFSTTGNRGKDWGKKKKFKEGQAEQVLDTLFFDFIDLAKKLQPKIVVAENVKGLLLGQAKKYVRKIKKQFSESGYFCQYFLLDSSKMGVPQKRERVFFIAVRNDLVDSLTKPKGMFDKQLTIDLKFNEKPIVFSEICDYSDTESRLTEKMTEYWNESKPGCSVGKFDSVRMVPLDRVCYTINSSRRPIHPISKREINDVEVIGSSSFPIDFSFCGRDCCYVCGMSVPPVMMAQIATRIYKHLLNKGDSK